MNQHTIHVIKSLADMNRRTAVARACPTYISMFNLKVCAPGRGRDVCAEIATDSSTKTAEKATLSPPHVPP